MIRRLTILLLIIGCAPKTTTKYYIGMTEQEFTNNNQYLEKWKITTDVGNGFWMEMHKVKTNDTTRTLPYFYSEQKEGFITWLSFGKWNHYYYFFNPETDTLTKVKYGSIKVD